MAKPENTGKRKEAGAPANPPQRGWIPLQTGTAIITVVSIFMAVLTAWQVIPVRGWITGLLYALLFGGLIWVIFFGMRLFYRIFR
ncbi:MAG: hypothetical protein ACLQCB_04275 [Spirochaetia bacterium]